MLAFLLGFYDSDGSLGLDLKTGKIRPRIASSDIKFLKQIKQYFRIKYNISSIKTTKFNISKEKMIEVSASRIKIDKKIFKEMIALSSNSLERK
ncbi:MAG: LAGLIDADG family homing endonuclease [Candidatus Thorarchaeota archaeon]